MGGVLSKVWSFMRIAWRSLRSASTRRDVSNDAGHRVEWNRDAAETRQGLDEAEDWRRRVDSAPIERAGQDQAAARAGVASPDPSRADVPSEVASAEQAADHASEDGTRKSDPAKRDLGERSASKIGAGESESAEADGRAVERKSTRRRKPRGPRRRPTEAGGARRADGQLASPAVDGEERPGGPRAARARIACRKTAGKWELMVVAGPEVVVRGGGDDRAGRVDSEFRVTEFGSVALIDDMVGGQEERIPFYAGEPMVFRLGNDWQGDGRKVSGVGVGHFLAIVPSDWTRLGNVPVEPEPCVDDGFRAHYFYRRRDDRAVEGFAERGVSSSVIELVGERIFDTSEQGELFVGEPPALKAAGMAWARVGAEGTSAWGETFRLDGRRSLADVLDGRQGWFFVRVYREGTGAEADSVQFRYLADMREIRVAGETYAEDTLLVPAGGHRTVDVQIVCAEQSQVVVVEARCGRRELEVRGGAVVCPPDPELKEVRCRVEAPRGCANVVVGLPRVWWGLSIAGRVPLSWRDERETVSREGFRKLALEGSELWIDVPRGIRRVGVGFGDESRIDHPARKQGSRFRCTVPLAHYLDHSQIDGRLFQDAVLAASFAEPAVGLMRVTADPPPRIVEFSVEPDRVSSGDVVVARWSVEDCDGVSVSLVPGAPGAGSVDADGSCEIRVEHRTLVTLTLSAPGMEEVAEERVVEVENPRLADAEKPVARARAGGGWRPAKGFSGGELSAVPGADRLPLRSDRRRRSVHAVNVASLRRWVNEQR